MTQTRHTSPSPFAHPFLALDPDFSLARHAGHFGTAEIEVEEIDCTRREVVLDLD